MQHIKRFLLWLGSAVALAVVAYVATKLLDHIVAQGHDIGWLGRLVISFPVQLWIIAFAMLLGLLYVCWPSISKLSIGNGTSTPATDMELMQVIGERDEARSRIAELESEIDKQFPDFKADIIEWQTPDPRR